MLTKEDRLLINMLRLVPSVSLIISALIFSIYARPQETAQAQPQTQQQEVQPQDEENAYIPYDYKYNVDNPPTNTFFGQNENNNVGPNGANGKYYVLRADGRMMLVEYYVDGESGFVPRISYPTNSNPTNGTETAST